MPDNENEEILREKEEKLKKQKRRSVMQVVIGLSIILIGIGIMLYPHYRQQISEKVNESAEDFFDGIIIDIPEFEEDHNSEDETSEGDFETEIGDTVMVLPGESEVLDPEDAALKQLPEINPNKAENSENSEPERQRNTNKDRLNDQKVIGAILIPKISLIYSVVEGTGTDEIGVAIGHMTGTKKIGAKGNCVLAGHRGGYSGNYFEKLDKLEIGDEVILANERHEQFVYKVTESFVVEPDEMWVAKNTGKEKAILTLITCENSGKQRLIVRCELEEQQ